MSRAQPSKSLLNHHPRLPSLHFCSGNNVHINHTDRSIQIICHTKLIRVSSATDIRFRIPRNRVLSYQSVHILNTACMTGCKWSAELTEYTIQLRLCLMGTEACLWLQYRVEFKSTDTYIKEGKIFCDPLQVCRRTN